MRFFVSTSDRSEHFQPLPSVAEELDEEIRTEVVFGCCTSCGWGGRVLLRPGGGCGPDFGLGKAPRLAQKVCGGWGNSGRLPMRVLCAGNLRLVLRALCDVR